jgi:hypothetical protein
MRWERVLLIPFLYACWLAMMTVHEAGHILHAWLSGGVVERVSIPLVGFSQTFFSSNPRPGFVAWGGAVWGCAIPILLLVSLARGPRLVRRASQFFSGFCLIANGVYLGVGWTMRAGDAGDLLRYGTPVWVLIAFGVIAASGGLYLWHRLGVACESARE